MTESGGCEGTAGINLQDYADFIYDRWAATASY
jgi:hypothetical protein